MSAEQKKAWDAHYEPENQAFLAKMKAGELSDDQQAKIKEMQQASAEKRKTIFQDIKAGNIERGEIGKKMSELQKTLVSDVMGVLSESQQKKFEELKGEKFEFKRRTFRATRISRVRTNAQTLDR